MRYAMVALQLSLLTFVVGNSTPASGPVACAEQEAGAKPLKLTPEQEKVVAVAQEFLKKTKRTWENPLEVKAPPNQVNVPDFKKYADEEKNIWKVVYQTPEKEFKRLGARTLFVNMRSKEVIPSVRK
jgi:hypothetical protein